MIIKRLSYHPCLSISSGREDIILFEKKKKKKITAIPPP